MQKLRFFIVMMAVGFSLAACIDEETSGQGMADLQINVNLTDAYASTRSSATRGYEDPENVDEMIQTLRFIIVRPDNTVEHNRYLDGNDFNPTIRYGYETFSVVDNEVKKVYLFVNEAGTTVSNLSSTYATLTERLEAIAPGTVFPVDEVSGWLVSLNSNSTQLPLPLPANECHEVEIPDKNEAAVVKKDLWVVRAATKFTYRIINNTRLDNLTLSKLTIDKMARKEYYMPNGAVYNDAWAITEYNIPSPDGTNNEYYTFEKNYNVDLPRGKTIQLPAIYLLEGKYTDADSGGLNYGTSLTVNGRECRDYLPNNTNLPRNTHVVITVTLNNVDSDVTWEVDIYPYTIVELDPVFGI